MALKKEITLNTGIPVSYHRVVGVNNITNVQSIIEVGSYVSKEQRERELEISSYNKENPHNTKVSDIYVYTQYIPLPYDEGINVVTAYDYLKKLDTFKDAENI